MVCLIVRQVSTHLQSMWLSCWRRTPWSRLGIASQTQETLGRRQQTQLVPSSPQTPGNINVTIHVLTYLCLFVRWEHRPSTKEPQCFLSVAIHLPTETSTYVPTSTSDFFFQITCFVWSHLVLYKKDVLLTKDVIGGYNTQHTYVCYYH